MNQNFHFQQQPKPIKDCVHWDQYQQHEVVFERNEV